MSIHEKRLNVSIESTNQPKIQIELQSTIHDVSKHERNADSMSFAG